MSYKIDIGLNDNVSSFLKQSKLWEKHGPKIEDALEKEGLLILPESRDLFKAFSMFPIEDLRVVIIGQDPYINKGEANGMCFSVPNGCKMPPSLRNIFKELHNCYGITRTDTDLTDWAKQGVLLLNTALTVREKESGSHAKIWKDFTKDLIKYIGTHCENIVYLLWGKHAQSFKEYIINDKNYILEHSHPSPLSRKKFVGNRHFLLCNEYLVTKNKTPINWYGASGPHSTGAYRR